MSAENELQALSSSARDATGALESAGSSARDFAKEQKDLTNALKMSAMNLSKLGGQLGRGTADLESFNGVLEVMSLTGSKATVGLSKWADQIAGAGGKLGAFGKILGGAAGAANIFNKATLASAKFLTERLNTSYKIFQQFGSVGALGAEGIEGLLDQSINAKIGLEAWGKVVMNNSETLARFGGSTASGAQKFSELISELADPARTAGDELRKLGLNGEDISNWAATYIASEQRMGRARAQTSEELTQGTIRYVKELDELSRLTGTSKEALEKQRQAAELDQAYRATLYKMEQEGNKEGAERLRKTISAIGAAFGPEYQKAAMAQASGLTSNEYAMAGMTSTSGQLAGIMNDLIGPSGDVAQTMQRLQGAVKENLGTMADYTQATHNQGGVVLNFVESLTGASMDLSKIGQPIKDEQNRAAQTQNALTNNVITATKSLQELSVEMATLAKEALPAAAWSVKTLGTAAVATARYLMSIVGPSGGAGPQNPPGMNATPGGAATGQVPSGGQLAPRSRSTSQSGGGESGSRGITAARSPIAFGGSSGTRQSFAGLDSNLQAAVMDAAQSFYDTTGQPLMITSAKRSREDQERLYNDYITGRSPYPAARPGTSAHEQGQAVDIGNFNAAMEQLYAAGLRQTVPGDPVHFQLSAATGGVLSGPKSGYGAMLHGTEAVVPLPDGRSIPVQNVDSDTSIEQLDRLDTIISVMRDQVTATQKLLQYAS